MLGGLVIRTKITKIHRLVGLKHNPQYMTSLKYSLILLNVLKRESRFTVGLNAAENTDYTKKCFKWKLLSMKFPTKMAAGAYVYL